MKLDLKTTFLFGALSLSSLAALQLQGCATTKEAAESGASNAEKELQKAPGDAEKSADYVEEDAKKTTEGDKAPEKSEK